MEVVGTDIAFGRAGTQASLVGIQQAVVDNEAGGYDKEVAGVAPRGCLLAPGIEQLPQQQGVHHPGFACAGSHLYDILGEVVLLLCQLGEVGFSQEVGGHSFVDVQYGLHTQHFMQVDNVQDGLSLSFVEIAGTLVHVRLGKPITQEVGRHGRHSLQHRAVGPGHLYLFVQAAGQFKGNIRFHALSC